jgi:hypothetical protein
MVCFCSAEGVCLDDLHWERRQYSAFDAYSESKLANVLFSVELARRLKGNEVIPPFILFSRLHTPFIRKSWQSLRRQAAVARSV